MRREVAGKKPLTNQVKSHYLWIFEELSSNKDYYKKEPKNLFKFWVLGLSLRQIEHYVGISKSSLSITFRKAFGEDYSKHFRHNIYSSVLKEAKTRRDREQIIAWCKKASLEDMISVIGDEGANKKYYSRGQMSAARDRKTKELKTDEY